MAAPSDPARAAEQAKIEELAAAKIREVQARPAATAPAERRLLALEKRVTEHGVALGRPDPTINLTTWKDGVVVYVDVLTQ